MMIEDLYKTTEKINAHIENMALNKVNIEFLNTQLEKALKALDLKQKFWEKQEKMLRQKREKKRYRIRETY